MTRPKNSRPRTFNSSVSAGVFVFGLLIAVFTLGCSTDEPASAVSSPISNSNETAQSNEAITPSNEAATPVDEPEKALPVEQASGKALPVEPPKKTLSDEPMINNAEFHEALQNAAEEYLQYPMVNSVATQAVADCEPPAEPEPRMSHSDDDSTHGQKLYYLFAKDITRYLSQDRSESLVGQVLVKESWTSKPSNPEARNLRNHSSGNRINPRTRVGDKVFEIGKRKDLFVMMKLDPQTAGTDQGWVYGVVNPETNQVTAAGVIASCARCHESAANDRLLGTVFHE